MKGITKVETEQAKELITANHVYYFHTSVVY